MLDYLRIMLNARLAKMDERGASAVEYGLLVAGIAAVIVAIVFLLGGTLSGVFTKTNSSIQQLSHGLHSLSPPRLRSSGGGAVSLRPQNRDNVVRSGRQGDHFA